MHPERRLPTRILVGRYELGAQHGTSALGVLWEAADLVLRRDVLVEEITAGERLPEAERGPFDRLVYRNAGLLARSEHPGAVVPNRIVRQDRTTYLITSRIDAPTLAGVLDRDGPVSPERAAAIGHQLVTVLDVVHAQGLLHRDVRPANVLVLHDGRVRLTRFLPCVPPGPPPPSADAAAYAAPAGVDEAEADVWSLGATLYHAVEGDPPFGPGGAGPGWRDQPPEPRRAGPLAPVIQALMAGAADRRPGLAVLAGQLAGIAGAGLPGQEALESGSQVRANGANGNGHRPTGQFVLEASSEAPPVPAPVPARVISAPEAPPSEAPERAPVPARARRHARWPAPLDIIAVDGVLLAMVLWLVSLRGADPRAMTDLGLVSLLTVPMVAALVILTAGFFAALRRDGPGWLLGAHLLAFSLLVAGTPALLFGTVRYSWAWKHVAVVDYIFRTGAVDTTIHGPSVNQVYHGWPGFFAGDALLTELAGRSALLPLATWTQLAFNLLGLLAVRFLLRSLTSDRRVIWTALWLFAVTAWLGLDYYSPQGLSFPLYVVLAGLVLRACRRPATVSPAPMRIRTALPIMVVLMAVIASSHQITPLMMVLSLVAVFALRQARGWYVPVLAVALTAGWALVVAHGYTLANLAELTLAKPLQNGVETFEQAADVRGGQVLVAWADRFTTAAGLALATVGIFRAFRRRRLDLAALLFLLSPGLALVFTEYGGEVLFRVVLFQSPFMAYFAALAIYPDGERRRATLRAVTAAACSLALLPAFLLAYYGKDAQTYFTPDELAGVTQLYEQAGPGSFIVEGTGNYPTPFRNYERFHLISIADEPHESRRLVLADPARRLTTWVNGDQKGYVLITRSMKMENDQIGPMPVGAVDRIERSLRDSPRWRVVIDTGDAVVFKMAVDGGEG